MSKLGLVIVMEVLLFLCPVEGVRVPVSKERNKKPQPNNQKSSN